MSGNSGHTPGPWHVLVDKDGTIRVGPSHNCTVATVYFPPVGDREASARLIAAAPLGFEAAHIAYLSLLTVTSVVWRLRNMQAYCYLRDFIAEATGRTSQEVQEEYEARATLAEANGGES